KSVADPEFSDSFTLSAQSAQKLTGFFGGVPTKLKNQFPPRMRGKNSQIVSPTWTHLMALPRKNIEPHPLFIRWPECLPRRAMKGARRPTKLPWFAMHSAATSQ